VSSRKNRGYSWKGKKIFGVYLKQPPRQITKWSFGSNCDLSQTNDFKKELAFKNQSPSQWPEPGGGSFDPRGGRRMAHLRGILSKGEKEMPPPSRLHEDIVAGDTPT